MRHFTKAENFTDTLAYKVNWIVRCHVFCIITDTQNFGSRYSSKLCNAKSNGKTISVIQQIPSNWTNVTILTSANYSMTATFFELTGSYSSTFQDASLVIGRLCGPVVRFPALPNFLRSIGSGTGFTQPCEELLGRKSSGSNLENLEYGRRDPSRWPRRTLNPQKLALVVFIFGLGVVFSPSHVKWVLTYMKVMSCSLCSLVSHW
jgi:hypothetical protein